MLKVNNIYEIYIRFSVNKIEELKKQNEVYKNNLLILNNKIKKYETVLEKYCRTDVDTVLAFNNKSHIKNVYFPNYPIYDKGNKINFKALKLYITKYIEYNHIFTKNTQLIKKYKKEIISKRVFVAIIKKFNSKIVDKIVYNNLNFTINKLFGTIGIYKVVSKRQRINWGQSTKNKNKLLEQGKIPYIKADAENNPNYKGEQWIVYRSPLDFFIQWRRNTLSQQLNPMLADYSFIPARGNNSFVSRLGEFKKDVTKALKTYTREDNGGI